MIYLDNAATSWPKPQRVYEEMIRCMKEYGANPGRSGHTMAIKASEKIYECRENLCKLFGISNPLCVSFTSNTTEALNVGIKGILKPGDHVITTSMEHNSVIRPLKKLEASGVNLSIAKADSNGKLKVEDIFKLVNNKTKMIVVTHASNVTGNINPIGDIGRMARKKGILFMVDAAQTAGIVPIDVDEMAIDVLAFPGHKGLLGPQGTGGLYIREGIQTETLKEGGTGSISESPYQPDFMPDMHESGTLNTPGIAGLNEGVKFILEKGISEMLRHERELLKYFLEGLFSIPKVKVYGLGPLNEHVGVVSINIGNKDSVEVCTQLDKDYGIAVRGGLHCAYLAHRTIGTIDTGTVRFSMGCFTTRAEIEQALSAINRIARN
ncbi:MAG: aminotransferase class V-fold PLP-dependent enzyme [Clostridiaceae bacterium]|nr:aminotransferase class V-fold PLP-dependent enzyme [Clostridiaceae bacterium]